MPSASPAQGSFPPAAPFGRSPLRQRSWPRWIDLAIFAALLGTLYVLFSLGRQWLGPFTPAATISLDPRALPRYAAYSLARIAIAYLLSLGLALGYGYAAARSTRAERWLLPLLDILQSIPVLSFLPGVMLAMVVLFPRRQLGLELGSILLIVTGQAWNMAFSFYSSLKSIPRELDEAARLYRFSRWQRFTELELPYAAIGLVWNSVMSVAGAWFFLMACETFVLGRRDFRLPGLGSYLEAAASLGNTSGILWGTATMIGLIILLDQFFWRPVIAWSDKFKFEQIEGGAGTGPGRSVTLELLRRSAVLGWFSRRVLDPTEERLTLAFARRHRELSLADGRTQRAIWKTSVGYVLVAAVAAVLGYAAFEAVLVLAKISGQQFEDLVRSAGLTFLRVTAALLLGAAWAVPAGVAIGFNPRLARLAQPIAQIAASVPATALFPVVLLVLVRAGGGMNLAALTLMLLGTQWYILFNVIAGATTIPAELKEAARIFRFSGFDRWRRLILPGIFPHFVTGMVTASGGAWNASIVAEYFHFKGQILSTAGLGATINRSTDAGDIPVLLAATVLMATVVVVINRLIWQRLYRLAETRFRLES